MKVLKSINNNVVSCLDENGRELVAMGRGLGFAVRSGDELDISRAEKVFRMQSPDETRRLPTSLPPFRRSRSNCAAALWTGQQKTWVES